jgi:DNA repair protein RadC
MKTARLPKIATTQRFTITTTINTLSENAVNYLTNDPQLLYQYWQDVIATQPDFENDKESFIVVCMNAKLKPILWHRISVGTLNQALAHPRECMRPVLISNAYAFALMHNHPSGDPHPSDDDNKMTRKIAECASIFNIRMLDHLIVGKYSPDNAAFFSYREAGLI